MQKAYTVILNRLFIVTGRIEETTRNAVLFMCCLCLMWMYFFGQIKTNSGEVQIVGSVFVIAITVFSVNQELKPIKWNRFTAYSMVLFGIGVFLIGLIHKVGDGYMMYAADLAIVFPALYFVWGNRGDHEVLYRIISKAILLSSVISFSYCFYLSTRGELGFRGVRVQGYLSNPNYLGMLGSLAFVAGAYLLLENLYNTKSVWLSSLGIGVGMAFAFVAVSRTAMLSELTCLIVLIIFASKQCKIGNVKNPFKWKTMLGVAVIIIVVVSIGIKMDDINYYVIERNNTLKNIEEPDSMTQSVQPNVDEIEKLVERTDVKKDADALSSGRIGLWRIYLDNLSWLGKPKKEINPLLSEYAEARPHNNIIDYLYRCGYIVGSLYVFYYIAQGISGLKMLFSRACIKPECCFTVMMIGTYSIYSMLEVCTLAFIRIIPCVYFLSITPIIACKCDDSE